MCCAARCAALLVHPAPARVPGPRRPAHLTLAGSRRPGAPAVSVAGAPPPGAVLSFGLSRRSGVLGVPPPRVLALGTPSATLRAAPLSRRSRRSRAAGPPRPHYAGPGARSGRSVAAPPLPCCSPCTANRRRAPPAQGRAFRGRHPQPQKQAPRSRGGPNKAARCVERSAQRSGQSRSAQKLLQSRSKAALRASILDRNSAPNARISACLLAISSAEGSATSIRDASGAAPAALDPPSTVEIAGCLLDKERSDAGQQVSAANMPLILTTVIIRPP